MTTRSTIIMCIAAALLGAGQLVHAAEGYELIGYGPVHKGIAGAGVASPEDTSWMLLNPASITKLDRRFDFYIDAIFVQSEITPRGLIANPGAGHLQDQNLLFSPGMGYVQDWRGYTVGIGNFGGAGTRTHYDKPRSLLGLFLNSDRRSEYAIARYPIAIAKEFDNGWRAGFALQLNGSRLKSDSVTLSLQPTRGDYEDSYSFGAGFVVGVQRDWDEWSFGASFSSRQWHTDHEEYGDLLSYPLDQPMKYQIGFAYRPTEKLELLLDYKHIYWSDVSQFGRKAIVGGLDWNDQEIVKFGLRYQATDKLKLRFGVQHGDSPVDSNATFMSSPFPALLETHLTAGFSYRATDRIEWHAAIVYALTNDQIERGQGDLFSIAGRGTRVETALTTAAFGFTYHF